MRRHWWKILLAASLCLNAGFISSVAIHRMRHSRAHTQQELDLSPQAKARFEASESAFRARMEALHDELRGERAKMMDLLATESPSSEALKAQQNRVMDVNQRILQTVTDHVMEVKGFLSPQEQRLFFDRIRHRNPEPDRRSPSSKEEKQP